MSLIRLRIALALFLLWCVPSRVVAQSEREPKPHPWIATAPGEFVRLIERGRVRIDVDDRRLAEAGKGALTLFKFTTKYDFRYQVQWIGSKRGSSGWEAQLTAWAQKPVIEPSHTILFPTSFQPGDPWRTPLMKHEFDHVAISTDPRWKKLLTKTLTQKRTWSATFEQVDRPTEEEINGQIREKMQTLIGEFERLAQAQYDLLDKASSDGLVNLGDRTKFFKNLYGDQTLKDCNFLYLDAARVMMQDSSDRDVTEHYLFLD